MIIWETRATHALLKTKQIHGLVRREEAPPRARNSWQPCVVCTQPWHLTVASWHGTPPSHTRRGRNPNYSMWFTCRHFYAWTVLHDHQASAQIRVCWTSETGDFSLKNWFRCSGKQIISFLTSYAILQTSFGGKGAHMSSRLIARPPGLGSDTSMLESRDRWCFPQELIST